MGGAQVASCGLQVASCGLWVASMGYGLQVASCGLRVNGAKSMGHSAESKPSLKGRAKELGFRVVRSLILDTRYRSLAIIRLIYLLVCLNCIGNCIVPLPGIIYDGSKRFHHSSSVFLFSEFRFPTSEFRFLSSDLTSGRDGCPGFGCAGDDFMKRLRPLPL